MLRYLAMDIICSEKQTVFASIARGKLRALRNRMSKDKYPSVLSYKVVAIVFIVLQIFF